MKNQNVKYKCRSKNFLALKSAIIFFIVSQDETIIFILGKKSCPILKNLLNKRGKILKSKLILAQSVIFSLTQICELQGIFLERSR
jgi:hypothetical protein